MPYQPAGNWLGWANLVSVAHILSFLSAWYSSYDEALRVLGHNQNLQCCKSSSSFIIKGTYILMVSLEALVVWMSLWFWRSPRAQTLLGRLVVQLLQIQPLRLFRKEEGGEQWLNLLCNGPSAGTSSHVLLSVVLKRGVRTSPNTFKFGVAKFKVCFRQICDVKALP